VSPTTTKPNTKTSRTPHSPATHGDLHGVTETQGPLIRQPAPAARLAHILNRAATDLWDVSTLTDSAQMWEESRAIASRILASCPIK
jgi:hypothetical protein